MNNDELVRQTLLCVCLTNNKILYFCSALQIPLNLSFKYFNKYDSFLVNHKQFYFVLRLKYIYIILIFS